MVLQLNTSRSLISKKLAGAFIAIFALLAQPLIGLNVPAAFAAPVINEVMPNPVVISDANGEWVELKNDDDVDVDISGWTIAGGVVPSGQIIAAGGYYVLCNSIEATSECDGVSTSSMNIGNNGTRTLRLKNAVNALIDEFTYVGSTGGQSIEVVNEAGEKIGVNNDTDAYQTNEAAPASGNTGTPGSKNSSQPQIVNISNVTELRAAIRNQTDGQTWNVAAGQYGLAPFDDIMVQGQAGWYFPVTANNLTINGAGEGVTTIYGTGYTPNGNWATQNLVSVFGNGVTINGMTFMPKVEPNKTIEVLGSDFTLMNSTIEPNTLTDQSEYDNTDWASEARQWGGSLYFSHAGSHVIENVTIKNSGISYRYSPTGTNITLSNVVLDYTSNVDWINSYRYSSGFNSSGNAVTGAPSVVYHLNNTLNNLASVLSVVKDGDVIEVDSDLELTQQLTVSKAVTINGNGNTITGTFAKTDNSNNSVIGVQSNGVTISELTVDAGSVGNQLHGINIYESDVVALNSVVALNGRSGVVVGQGSTVTINGIETTGNAWHGVNVDKAGAYLTISGDNSHSSLVPAIFVDDATVIGGVDDTNSQYSVFENGNAHTYVLTTSLSSEDGDTITLPSVDGVATTPTNHPMELPFGDTTVTIPAETIVTASSTDWDGTILAPVASAYVVQGDYETALALTVGSNNYTLTFDKPVKLVLAGQAGKRVGFVFAGSSNFTEITTVCSTNDELGIGSASECKFNDGEDLVVWTKHFTTFVTYSDAQNGSSTSSNNAVTISALQPIATNTTNRVVAVNYGSTGETTSDSAVLGTKTTKSVAKTATPVVQASEEGWKLLGMAWYWWAVIIAAVGGLGWAGMSWLRGRNAA